jgi:hypothetical protein
MHRILVIPMALAAAACTMQGDAASSSARDRSLDAVIAGRTAGTPVSCVELRQLRGNRSFGPDAILFEGPTSSLAYVNRPAGGCAGLNRFRAIKLRTTSSQLCRGDIVTVFDPSSGAEFGSCPLGDFTPYRR